jgi:hypothetical protein
MNAGAMPTTPISTPATAGPMILPTLKTALFRPTALGSSVDPTISVTNDWRAGMSKEVAQPSSSASR